MNKPSGWDLIIEERFDEACLQADREFAETHSFPYLRHKVFALLNLGNFGEASALCREIENFRNGETSADFIFEGVAEWLSGSQDKAIDAWRRGLRTKYADAAGGVQIPLLLLFAAKKRNDGILEEQANKMLRKLLKMSESKNWPGPLANYVIDEMSDADLLAQVSTKQYLREKQLCQATFYIAIKHFGKNEIEAYQDNLKIAVEQRPRAFVKAEYYLAKNEASKAGIIPTADCEKKEAG